MLGNLWVVVSVCDSQGFGGVLLPSHQACYSSQLPLLGPHWGLCRSQPPFSVSGLGSFQHTPLAFCSWLDSCLDRVAGALRLGALHV